MPISGGRWRITAAMVAVIKISSQKESHQMSASWRMLPTKWLRKYVQKRHEVGRSVAFVEDERGSYRSRFLIAYRVFRIDLRRIGFHHVSNLATSPRFREKGTEMSEGSGSYVEKSTI